jgi:predicted Zn-dependent protease
MKLLSTALASLLILSMPAQAQLDLSLPEMGQPANQAMTPADERRLGTDLMRQLRQSLPLVEDPAVNGYIQDLGMRLASHADAGEHQLTFFVVDSPRINAFAMPGGYIGINRGLIAAARSESELAGVLAHEIAHVTQRHIARRMLQSEGLSMRTAAMVLAGILLGMQNPQAGAAAAIGGIAGSVESQLAFSRDFEREADRVGIRILADADFNPEGMPRFFNRLLEESRYRREPPPYLSTHPLTTERIADTRSRAADLEPDKVFESTTFDLVKARIEVAGQDSAEAAVQHYRQATAQPPDPPAERYGLALALARDGRHQAAREIVQTLIEEHGEYAIYYLTLGEIALAEGQAPQAIKALETGLSLFPGDYALMVTRIDALLAAGRAQDALRASTDATTSHPDDPALHQLRARAASAAGDSAEAALALSEYFAVQGDLRSALNQVERVLENPAADGYQRSRAEALQKTWREALERQQS